MDNFKLFRQHERMDCGPTCLRMVAKYYGRTYSLESLRQQSGISREGVSLLGISEAAENIGFRTVGVKKGWFHFVYRLGIWSRSSGLFFQAGVWERGERQSKALQENGSYYSSL